MDAPITAVLIDTVAYHYRQCDFAGITSSMIPTFLRLLDSNGISILSHHILDNEVRKHIKESQIVERAAALRKPVKQCKDLLALLGFSADEILEKAETERVGKILLDAYAEFREKFVWLPYVHAEDVFNDYFSAKPPFSASGDKKSEFPDAFVLKGLHHFCEENPTAHILVVSNDSDWKKTVEGNAQIKQVDTIKDAVAFLWMQLDDKMEFLQNIMHVKADEIKEEVARVAEHDAFNIYGYDTVEEVDIDRVIATSIDETITPLKVTQDSALIHAIAHLSVDGTTDYLDESRSVWDREDRCYYFEAYTRMNFKKGVAEVEFEVELGFPNDGSMKPIEVRKIRTTNKWDISIDVDEAEVTEEDITDYGEDDWRAEHDEALEDFYKH